MFNGNHSLNASILPNVTTISMTDHFAPHPVLFTNYTANIVVVNSMGRSPPTNSRRSSPTGTSPPTNDSPPPSKCIINLGMYHSYTYIHSLQK